MFDADAAGFQLVVHAIGDRANAMVLDIIAEARARARPAGPASAHRARAGRAARRTRPRFASLGVIASIQPSHCIDDMRWAEKRIGRERCAIRVQLQVVRGRGRAPGVRHRLVRRAAQSDARPLRGGHAAVPRRHAAGGWFPEERITLAQAVEYYTLGSAYAEFAETRKGSHRNRATSRISSCFEADIFDDAAARDPRRRRRSLTVVGGRVVYEATVGTLTSNFCVVVLHVRLARHLPDALGD